MTLAKVSASPQQVPTQQVVRKAPTRKFKFGELVLGLATSLAILAQAEIAFAGVCRADLPGKIDAIADKYTLDGTDIGILIEDLTPDTRALYARNAQEKLVPASNVKLLTTAAALQALGPDFSIRTSVYGQPDAAIQDLYVVGRGDPTFTSYQINLLSSQLKQKGVRRVNSLTAVDNHFTGPVANPYWDEEDYRAGYGAVANSLILNRNELGFTAIPNGIGQLLSIVWDRPEFVQGWRIENNTRTVGDGNEFIDAGQKPGLKVMDVRGQLIAGTASENTSIALLDPGSYFAEQFQQSLSAYGLGNASVQVTTTSPPEGTVELAAIESPPLRAFIDPTNLYSVNIYAEAMIKTLGRSLVPETGNAYTAGAIAVGSVLTELGVSPDGISIVDGSGLSKQNKVTPEAFVETLQVMARTENATTYRNSLAVAGSSGTLRNRMQGTLAEGRFQGKTGTLSNTYTLSGYLNPPNHPPLVLSILINNTDASGRDVRGSIDQIVTYAASLDDC
ncbi:D-alanyl-D-alanine carboxypeptidase/D-alanyl-D-alanine-endopeptidase [Synechococcus sp. PCC 7335]|uniref:D-alanyl-D-alanine carboxypeptidase/D-alanyl-D-alanine endopeptidase n=1 Tax=Synechococcus sp. (strain ATCC 29403 / PCC 7335) TaxID=91464 RepID=UPI00017EBFF9|nr:D-alanyl-D-alanine carboxypeptidase/D-alanyl-D-alanine-endopeptidase [Synechococcus sp. PCC 7335]EDX85096.1 D-alanyl-D-alanine carboxypeptidase/D-alanyl-D-alanine-endopeptidase [Synechococcus sp. PCC 7335]